MMQGRQRIKDIVAALTDTDDIDHQLRSRTLNTTLMTLLKEQYLRTVNWWNIMPAFDLHNKIALEEEKKLRGEDTTSASLSAKTLKEAAKGTADRLKTIKGDDRVLEGVKRKANELIDVQHLRESKRRRIDNDVKEEKDELDFDVCLWFAD
jgi:hypothetical protein